MNEISTQPAQSDTQTPSPPEQAERDSAPQPDESQPPQSEPSSQGAAAVEPAAGEAKVAKIMVPDPQDMPETQKRVAPLGTEDTPDVPVTMLPGKPDDTTTQGVLRGGKSGFSVPQVIEKPAFVSVDTTQTTNDHTQGITIEPNTTDFPTDSVGGGSTFTPDQIKANTDKKIDAFIASGGDLTKLNDYPEIESLIQNQMGIPGEKKTEETNYGKVLTYTHSGHTLHTYQATATVDEVEAMLRGANNTDLHINLEDTKDGKLPPVEALPKGSEYFIRVNISDPASDTPGSAVTFVGERAPELYDAFALNYNHSALFREGVEMGAASNHANTIEGYSDIGSDIGIVPHIAEDPDNLYLAKDNAGAHKTAKDGVEFLAFASNSSMGSGIPSSFRIMTHEWAHIVQPDWNAKLGEYEDKSTGTSHGREQTMWQMNVHQEVFENGAIDELIDMDDNDYSIDAGVLRGYGTGVDWGGQAERELRAEPLTGPDGELINTTYKTNGAFYDRLEYLAKRGTEKAYGEAYDMLMDIPAEHATNFVYKNPQHANCQDCKPNEQTYDTRSLMLQHLILAANEGTLYATNDYVGGAHVNKHDIDDFFNYMARINALDPEADLDMSRAMDRAAAWTRHEEYASDRPFDPDDKATKPLGSNTMEGFMDVYSF